MLSSQIFRLLSSRTPNRMLQRRGFIEQTTCQCKSYMTSHTPISTHYKNNVCVIKRSLGSSKAAGKRSPVTWASLAVFLVTGGVIVFYVKNLKELKEIEREKERTKSIGKAAIGGPFELIDTNGKTVTNKDFTGKWILLYFGFCHCPDICPDQLEKISSIIERLEKIKSLPEIQPLFVTVDPHRDTVEHIKDYIKDFHPRMIGLTGSDEQIKNVCKAYRVYYSSGPKDEDNDYIVDHTVILYLLNADGEFTDYFGQNRTIEEITGAISTKMALSRKKKT